MTQKAKNKLHALLAVEGDVKSQADQITKETISVFKSKGDHFLSNHASYEPLEEGGRQLDPEGKEMVTTVDEKLEHTEKAIIRALDATMQKEATNTEAKADLVVDGETLAEQVPATALLHLEGRLKQIRDIYKAIPTLPPGLKWNRDEHDKPGVYVADPKYREKTEKREETIVVVPPTKEHPAQVRDRTKDIPIGKWTIITRAGVWTPHQKSETLERVDNLLRGVKRSRQRANDIDVVKLNMGRKLFSYIHGK